jgi:transcriptional regulator with XRE-family HTH domain
MPDQHTELKTLIKESGYNSLQIAKMLNYSQSVVYNWTYGKNEPCAKDMVRLADMLGVSVERIVLIFANR